MAESSWPTVAGGRAIDDVQWERMAVGFMANGIFGVAGDTPVVYADSTGLQVKIRAQKSGNLRGHGWYSGTSEFTRAIGANASGSTRVDLVVLRLTRSSQEVSIVVKAGTPGAGPPALTQDSIASGTGVYEIAIAQVTVPSGASTISASNVVNVAPYVIPRPALAGPKLITMLYNTIIPTRTFTNSAAPSSDSEVAVGMFAGSRQTITKLSPDSDLCADVTMSGYMSATGAVLVGVRIMAPGYTSSNHLINNHFFNVPRTVTSSSSSGHTHSVGLYHQHHTWSGKGRISGLPVNTYTVQAWIYLATAGLVLTVDANDHFHFELSEVL